MDAPSVDLLVQQHLAQGDVRGAARLLVLHHADVVHATCKALVRDGTLAEDLSQEAFARAIAALPGFRGAAQSRTWLLSIARNLCFDHLRRQKGPIDERAELDVEAEPSEAPPPFELLARRTDLERGLAVLGETERALVVLHHAHGVGYPELAGSFGIAEGALRMRMSRALGKVRAALEAPPVFAAAAMPMLASVATAPERSSPTEEGAARPTGWLARVREAVAGPPPAPPAPSRALRPAPPAPPKVVPSAPPSAPLAPQPRVLGLGAPSAPALLWGASSALRARLAALVA